MLAGDFRGKALVVFHFQGLKQGVLRVFAHEGAVCLRIQMTVASGKGVILAVQLPAQNVHPALFAIGFFRIYQFAQGIPDVDHGNQALPGRVVFDRGKVVSPAAEFASGFEDNFAALGFDAQRSHFQGLKVRRADELLVERRLGRVFPGFGFRHEQAGRQDFQACGNFLAQIHQRRISHTIQRIPEHPPGIGHFAYHLAGVGGEVGIDGGWPCASIFQVFSLNSGGLYPILAVLLFPGVFLEEDNIGGDIGQGVLPECGFRQADGPQEIGVLRNMLPHGGINGIQEETADHERAYAAFPQQAQGFGDEVVMNGKLAQFREIRVIQGLIAERRVADGNVKGWNNKMGVLEAAIDVIGFGVKILRYGRCRGVKFHGQKLRVEPLRAKADEIAAARR